MILNVKLYINCCLSLFDCLIFIVFIICKSEMIKIWLINLFINLKGFRFLGCNLGLDWVLNFF